MKTSFKRRYGRIKKASRRYQNDRRKLSPGLFEFDAIFRIFGVGEFHDEITEKTGLKPTKSWRAGDLVSPRGQSKRRRDFWGLDSPLGASASLDEHADWLAQAILPHKAYFSELIKKATSADLCFGCLSEISYPVIGVNSQSLRLIRELDLSLSFNFTC